MLNSDMLSNILSPETISELGIGTIREIKTLGKQTKYLTVVRENNPYSINQSLSYEGNRIKELSRGYITKNLSNIGKTLFCSEIKFINDEQIITLLNRIEISIDDINDINELIRMCQKADIEYTLAVIKLENKYDLKVDQAFKIIKLKPSLLNNHYKLNQEDIALYNKAQKMLLLLKTFTLKKEKALNSLNRNAKIKKLIFIAKDFFGIDEENIFIFINKINELAITHPEQLVSKNKQKSLKKED